MITINLVDDEQLTTVARVQQLPPSPTSSSYVMQPKAFELVDGDDDDSEEQDVIEEVPVIQMNGNDDEGNKDNCERENINASENESESKNEEAIEVSQIDEPRCSVQQKVSAVDIAVVHITTNGDIQTTPKQTKTTLACQTTPSLVTRLQSAQQTTPLKSVTVNSSCQTTPRFNLRSTPVSGSCQTTPLCAPPPRQTSQQQTTPLPLIARRNLQQQTTPLHSLSQRTPHYQQVMSLTLKDFAHPRSVRFQFTPSTETRLQEKERKEEEELESRRKQEQREEEELESKRKQEQQEEKELEFKRKQQQQDEEDKVKTTKRVKASKSKTDKSQTMNNDEELAQQTGRRKLRSKYNTFAVNDDSIEEDVGASLPPSTTSKSRRRNAKSKQPSPQMIVDKSEQEEDDPSSTEGQTRSRTTRQTSKSKSKVISEDRSEVVLSVPIRKKKQRQPAEKETKSTDDGESTSNKQSEPSKTSRKTKSSTQSTHSQITDKLPEVDNSTHSSQIRSRRRKAAPDSTIQIKKAEEEPIISKIANENVDKNDPSTSRTTRSKSSKAIVAETEDEVVTNHRKTAKKPSDSSKDIVSSLPPPAKKAKKSVRVAKSPQVEVAPSEHEATITSRITRRTKKDSSVIVDKSKDEEQPSVAVVEKPLIKSKPKKQEKDVENDLITARTRNAKKREVMNEQTKSDDSESRPTERSKKKKMLDIEDEDSAQQSSASKQLKKSDKTSSNGGRRGRQK
ncbi:unnamed protein product [Didymodactylos carnosus]|uniref:Uncharacterized protein n=1 Tax=Didymodactylos carnosus TaxID=1234261 RepID=A0A813RPX1_9BILA|nr:unnamed protein product [Didymodactylos carnosus]CAF3567661.1 unnamed protein product [Didymodactylos carnosus]